MKERLLPLLTLRISWFVVITAPLLSIDVWHGFATRAVAAQPADAPSMQPAKVEPAVSGIEIPMDTGAELPVVLATINGQGPFRLLLDTGSAVNILDDDVLKAVKLAPSGKARFFPPFQLHSWHAEGDVDTVRVASLALGKARFSGLVAHVIDLDRESAPWRDLDGLLGLATFADHLLEIDYPRKRITLKRGSLPPADGRDVLQYSERGGLAFLTLTFGSVEAPVAIVSGMKDALVLSDWLEAKVGLRESGFDSQPVGGFICDIDIVTPRIEPIVQVGRHELIEIPVSFESGLSGLGHEALRHFVVSFDQKNKRVRFSTAEEGRIRLSPRSRYGLVLTREGGKLKILQVLPDSSASMSVVRVGDWINGIEGHLIPRVTDDDVRKMLRESEALVLRIERGVDLLVLLKPQ